MKKIICLSGKADSGKAETLNLLIDLLEVATLRCSIAKPQPAGANRNRTFKTKEHIIVICTAGNSLKEVKSAIEYAEENKADIAVFATLSKGGTKQEIESLAKEKGAELVEMNKIIDIHDKENTDKKQAMDLLEIIETEIK